MDEETKKRLVAKVLKGPPYDVESYEELEYFFGELMPDESLAHAANMLSISKDKQLVVTLGDNDGKERKC